MNDDLISRKAVIEAVDRHTRDDGTLDDDISVILEEVETAFDKEKTIEELQTMKNHSESCKKQCEFASTEFFNYLGAEVSYKTSINIVEKGGIE